MPYKHYGNIGDIWKHLPLCSFLDIERPSRFIETNSASPIYELDKNPSREYGIFTYIDRMNHSPILKSSIYSKILNELKGNNNDLINYLGSPVLSMKILKDKVSNYIFFDIEKEPLDAIINYAEEKDLASKVSTKQQDSVLGASTLMSELGPSDFLHIDPYYAFEKGESGLSYYDIFLQATRQNVKCMLWYAFFTLQEKRNYYNQIMKSVKNTQVPIDVKKHKMKSIEIYLALIQEDEVRVNPGVLGCGILVSNLSDESLSIFEEQSHALIDIYKDTTIFGKYSGELIRETIF